MAHPSKLITLQNRLDAFFGIALQIITVVFISRLIIDTSTRLVYPFIPQISTGLGLSVVGFSWLIFIRAVSGMAGPIFGIMADRIGRRMVMVIALLCQAIGSVGIAFSWQWWATAPMILVGLSLSAFIPAEQAYISDLAPFQQRGRALGSIELSWALAGAISMPIVGRIIDALGWRTPFLLIGGLSVVGAVLVWFQLPATEQRSEHRLTLSEMWQIFLRPNVLAAMGVGLLLFLALGAFITVWGIWLSEDFKLDATALGLVATAIGFAELAGSGISSLIIDRLGKRRGSQLGLLLVAIGFLLLPFSQLSLATAVSMLVIMGLFIEFTIVSLLPLYAEQAPEARATVFSLIAFGVSIGVAAGSPIAATLWENIGLWPVALVSATCVVMALILTNRFLFEDILSPVTK